jgi:hypothetical protein
VNEEERTPYRLAAANPDAAIDNIDMPPSDSKTPTFDVAAGANRRRILVA